MPLTGPQAGLRRLPSIELRLGAASPRARGGWAMDESGWWACREPQALYLQCVRANGHRAAVECKPLIRDFLHCRMNNGLMAKEDLTALGLGGTTQQAATPSQQ